MKTRMTLVFVGLCTLALSLSPGWAQGPSGRGQGPADRGQGPPASGQGPTATVGQAIHHDTSPPLSEMAIKTTRFTGLSKEVPLMEKPDLGRNPGLAEPDGGLQSSYAPFFLLTPSISLSVPGLSEQDNVNTVGFAVVPPDTNGDIGLDENGDRIYIQYINSVWGVFDVTGSLTAGPFAGNTFWTGFGGFCEANNDGDPVVLYDDAAGRWFFSQFSVNQGIQCVAVSTTSDPLGPYHRYAFTVTPGGANDYPKLGVWDDGTTGSSGQSAYTFTTRDFGGTGGSFSVGAGVMERDAMLVGAPASFIKFINPCTAATASKASYHRTWRDHHRRPAPVPPTGLRSTRLSTTRRLPTTATATTPSAWTGRTWPSSTYTEGPLVVAGSNFDRFLGNGFSDCISPVNGGEAARLPCALHDVPGAVPLVRRQRPGGAQHDRGRRRRPSRHPLGRDPQRRR